VVIKLIHIYDYADLTQMEFQREIVMKFKSSSLIVLMLSVALLGQTLFVPSTVAQTVVHIDGSSDPARIVRLETLLESLRQELKIPAYSAAIVKTKSDLGARVRLCKR
jgi:hypothetical protein